MTDPLGLQRVLLAEAASGPVPVVRSIKLMSFEPLFATTTIPVEGFTATSTGAEDAGTEPTATRVAEGGLYVG